MKYFAVLFLTLACAARLEASAAAQSTRYMLDECSSLGKSYFRDFEARTDMRYNGQRVDGTHAINGRIFLETRSEDFACSYAPNERRMVEFFAEGRVQNAYLSRDTAAQRPRPPAADAGGTRTVRVRLPSGTKGTELTARVAPGGSVGYVINARNGQFLYARIAAKAPGLSYQIFNPDSSFLLDQISSNKDYRGEFWQSGDHVVEVINRGNGDASFNVIFGIE
jgi:hypothetical protein